MPQQKLAPTFGLPALPEFNARRCCAGALGLLVFGGVVFAISTLLKYGFVKSGQHEMGSSMITLLELSQHDTPQDCWMVVHESVFDVTEYAPHHPNPEYIFQCCGIDCTPLYDSVHPVSILGVIRRRKVGNLDLPRENTTSFETSEQPIPEVRYDELFDHVSPSDCWMAIFGMVYDVTTYAPFHPNPHYVTDYCGLEVSDLFDGAHDRSALKVVQKRIVGKLVVPTTANISPPSDLPSSYRYTGAPTPRPTFVDVSEEVDLLLGLGREP